MSLDFGPGSHLVRSSRIGNQTQNKCGRCKRLCFINTELEFVQEAIPESGSKLRTPAQCLYGMVAAGFASTNDGAAHVVGWGLSVWPDFGDGISNKP